MKRELGRGGMGVVYAAADEELGREVAIKLLYRGEEDGEPRLLREAQALARMSHPNVIQVFDVGVWEGRVFLAMELIEGATLSAWRTAQRRGYAEMQAVLMMAGRGLFGAHRAGLVHRDFKPENVMIRADGRVVVLDFGLAMAVDEGSSLRWSKEKELPVDRTDSLDSLDSRLTETGLRMGTPAYMAPEQWTRSAVDARTDQFAFCVTAYEALYGERPFKAETATLLAIEVTRGHVQDAPAGSSVPARVREALLIGLQPRAADRHPDMQSLLLALSARPRGTGALVVTAGVLGLSAAGWLALHEEADTDPCPPDPRIAAAWNAERREAIAQGMATAAGAFGTSTWQRVDQQLAAYATAWTEQRDAACHAAVGGAEDGLHDLRIACLDRSLLAFNALLDVFAEADAGTIVRGVSAAARLPPLEDCKDDDRLRSRERQPDDPDVRADAASVRTDLARAQALMAAGHYDRGEAIAADARERAQVLQWGPLLAEADFLRGLLLRELGREEEADGVLERAFLTAESEHLDDLAVRAGLRRAETLARLGRIDEAQRQLELAEARRDAGRDEGRSDLDRFGVQSRLAMARGDYAGARTWLERQLERAEERGVAGQLLADIEGNLAMAMASSGDMPGALPHVERAIEIREADVGPDHPDVARELHNYGSVLAQLGRFDDALPVLQRALEIKRARLGSQHTDVAYTLVSLGLAHEELGKPDAATAFLQEALTVQQAALGPDHPELGFTHVALAELGSMTGDLDAALASIRAGLSIDEKAWGPDDPRVASDLALLGRIHHERNESESAIRPLQRALEIYATNPSGPPHAPAEAKWVLARVLWELGRDRPRARTLAREALAHYEDPAAPRPDRAQAIHAWLDTH